MTTKPKYRPVSSMLPMEIYESLKAYATAKGKTPSKVVADMLKSAKPKMDAAVSMSGAAPVEDAELAALQSRMYDAKKERDNIYKSYKPLRDCVVKHLAYDKDAFAKVEAAYIAQVAVVHQCETAIADTHAARTHAALNNPVPVPETTTTTT